MRAKLNASGATAIRIEQADCFETLCKLELGFNDVESHERELSVGLDQVRGDFYAYVPDAQSTTAEMCVARPGHRLFPARKASLK